MRVPSVSCLRLLLWRFASDESDKDFDSEGLHVTNANWAIAVVDVLALQQQAAAAQTKVARKGIEGMLYFLGSPPG